MMITRTVSGLARRTQVGALALLGILAFGLDATAATKEEVMKMVSEEATRNGRVPVALALGVARVESNFNDQAVSSAGARGVMQIMPTTAMGEFGVPKEQLMDPQLNVKLGVAYLERLYNQYGQNWELALSHYNGGSLHTSGGRFVVHDYNRQYVSDVIRWSSSYQNDGTAVAMANGAGHGVQLASLAEEPRSGRYRRQAEPDWQEVRRTAGAPVNGDRALSDMLTESTGALRSRFRTSLEARGDVRWDRYTEQPVRPVETHNEEWPVESISAQQQAPVHTGRFNYAPYGSGGRFL